MRTQGSVEQHQQNNKWYVLFETFKGKPGNERCISVISSAALFETEDDAIEAQMRAMDVFEETGTFPDLAKFF